MTSPLASHSPSSRRPQTLRKRLVLITAIVILALFAGWSQHYLNYYLVEQSSDHVATTTITNHVGVSDGQQLSNDLSYEALSDIFTDDHSNQRVVLLAGPHKTGKFEKREKKISSFVCMYVCMYV